MSKTALALVILASMALGARAQDVPKPEFTPFTVAPALTNFDEARAALVREYPAALRDNGIGGRAEVWIHVTVEGRSEHVQLGESSGYDALDAAAVRVAGIFQFRPAENRGARVPVWISLPIAFQTR